MHWAIFPGKNDTEAVSFEFCGGLHHWHSSLGQQRYGDKKAEWMVDKERGQKGASAMEGFFLLRKMGCCMKVAHKCTLPLSYHARQALNNLFSLLLLLITQLIHRVKEILSNHQSQTPSARQIRHPQRTRGRRNEDISGKKGIDDTAITSLAVSISIHPPSYPCTPTLERREGGGRGQKGEVVLFFLCWVAIL